jgi:hypothetical protein
VTNLPSDFAHICKRQPDRIGIVSEGDSWFAYPRKWIAFGADINVIHHLEEKIYGTDTVNLLRLASSGDEAVDMTSGKQFKGLYKILKKNREHVQILMFSGGGNDIVGKNDMLPLLNEYEEGFGFLGCINLPRFEQRLEAIVLAYKRLISLCEDIVPHAKIITHTYDIAKPWDQGAEFFWGLIKTEPWVYPYMMRRGIPEDLHLPVLDHMLKKFGEKLIQLSLDPSAGDRLVVVKTQGTLKPGSTKDWLNEIHPTPAGFKKIFSKIYDEMKHVAPDLPD